MDSELKTIMGTDGDGMAIDDSLEAFKTAIFEAVASGRPPDRIFIPYHYKGAERYMRLDQITWFGKQYRPMPDPAGTAARH